MRVLFTSDLHGRLKLYEEMREYCAQSGADVLIMGGDLLPTHLKQPYKLLTGGVDFCHALEFQLSFIDSFLVPFLNSLKTSIPGLSIIYVPGNHDWETSIEHLQRSAPASICLHGQAASIGGVLFMGYGCVIDSSFWVKDYVRRDIDEKTYIDSRYALVSTGGRISESPEGAYALMRPSIEQELKALSLAEPEKTVCVFHSPPYGTGIDTLHNGKPIGSRAIERFIRENRPAVSLHGHIHEAPYMSGSFSTMIGPTLAINPGHEPEALHAVIFDLDDPAGSVTHRVFGRMPVVRTGIDRTKDRYARMIKGLFMKKVLMK